MSWEGSNIYPEHFLSFFIERSPQKGRWAVITPPSEQSKLLTVLSLFLKMYLPWIMQTSRCLNHSSFLEATRESFIFFLQMDSLNVSSELVLLNASLKLAKSW